MKKKKGIFKMKIEGIYTIIYLERLNNRYYRNPRYLVTLADDKGDTLKAKTATNAAIVYIIEKGKWTLKIHSTKKGNLIIDDGKKIKWEARDY